MDIYELESEVKPLVEAKKKLLDAFKAEVDRDIRTLDAEEAGKVTDMIKDLSEAAKCCYEAKYFKSVICAMQEGGVEHEEENMGYNPNRSSRTGRYMRSGFRPMPAPWGDMNPEYYTSDTAMMGYSGSGRSGGSRSGGSSSQSTGYDWNPRRGEAYNEYKEARRHYTESKDPNDKKEMTARMTEHLMDTIATVREMWEDATPELRKKMKADFEALVKEMVV